jgi:hypothetical protein
MVCRPVSGPQRLGYVKGITSIERQISELTDGGKHII